MEGSNSNLVSDARKQAMNQAGGIFIEYLIGIATHIY